MKKKIVLFLYTIWFLKPIQIYYRIYYFIVKPKFKSYHSIPEYSNIHLTEYISNPESYSFNTFCFLNLSVDFNKEIDWNYDKLGKLWTYNLNYFDFLTQKNIRKEQGEHLMRDYASQINVNRIIDGIEPYPISLRGINWIKFITKHKINDSEINSSLFAQFKILLRKLEYHILGNHLLENGFSLLFGAYYFGEKKFLVAAKKIITRELKEQILSNGAHFELSPMYHRIILHRILDCYNLISNNNIFVETELAGLLKSTAERMIGWLNNMSYQDGSQPNFNDSTSNSFATKNEIVNYAESLGIDITSQIFLSDSGYRRIVNPQYELFVDLGNIGPDYQPGHAHSDTFNFELRIAQLPFIVDTGISTYEKNQQRQKERETEAHNTARFENFEQSEVWGGFRVGRRAKICFLQEDKEKLVAEHNGYKNKGIIHRREFNWNDGVINIYDQMKGAKETSQSFAFLHFHPDVILKLDSESKDIKTVFAKITFQGATHIEKYKYNFAEDFNRIKEAECVKITFCKELKTAIKLISK